MTEKEKKPRKETTALATNAEQPKILSVAGLISQGLTTGASVDAMKGLYEIFEKERADQRRSMFNEAMGTFQSKCPTIRKTKPVKDYAGNVKYSYAPLESIVEQVKVLIDECGFSYRIQSAMTAGGVKATCIVNHKDGHSEETSVEVSKMKAAVNREGKALMSAPQEDAATLTYAKRYAFCNAFGIMTGDEDTGAVQPVAAVRKTTTAAPDQKTEFDLAKQYIAGLKLESNLVEARTRVNESVSFTNQEKVKLMGIINDKIKAEK